MVVTTHFNHILNNVKPTYFKIRGNTTLYRNWLSRYRYLNKTAGFCLALW